MADTAVADPPPPPPSTADDFNGVPAPPMDPNFFNQDLPSLNLDSVDQDDIMLEDLDFDFDFSFDLLSAPIEQPASDPTHFDSNGFILPGSDANFTQFASVTNLTRALKSTSPEFTHVSGKHLCGDGAISNSSSSAEPEICQLSGHQVSGGQRLGNNQLSRDLGHDVSGYLNFPSPESNGSKGSNDSRVLNCPSPESQGSGNCLSDVSEDSNKSVSSSLNFGNISGRSNVNGQKIKLEELNTSHALLKRKKVSEDSNISDSRTNKFRKSSNNLTDNVDSGNNNNVVLSEEEEKRRARLMRNRESAQLSRQRKKHYVEELEDKVKNMGSTIQELNAQIAYISHENARLRQQLGGGMVPPPPPGMYPQMMYPWMPCGVQPYLVKPQGSQVPLVPIPRLKPQQPVPAPKTSKKAESKKSEKSEGKTKKVASVSFLGLMFFILLFGGLVPMVNVRYGSVREAFGVGSGYYAGNQFYEKHQGRVLAVDGNMSGTNFGDKYIGGRDFVKNKHHGRGHGGSGESTKEHGTDEFAQVGNGSAPLAASLYVPRNDKLVKIDGNLIIHSVLASEKAMASRDDHAKKAGAETRLAVHGDLVPVVPVSGGRPAHPHRNPSERQRALGSPSVKEGLKSSVANGRLQQWFREGLEGPMLSSGMCTEVFQFDVSSAIVPATPTRNVSVEQRQNTTHLNKGKNRRILRGLPGSPHNISDEHAGSNSQKENNGNNTLSSSMVVSVLVDPREVSDVDGNGVLGPKSLSRIFVVVLIDGMKYVTYSCMLPFKGAAPHLVTT